MRTIFGYALARYRGAILGWGLTLGLLGMYLAVFYDILAEQRDTLEALISSYPPEMMAFFGEATEIFTPAGFLSIEFFSYMPIVLGIFAILAGSGLLAADEENGTLDLVLAHPVSRTRLFLGRVLAWLTATAAILALMWVGLSIGAGNSTMDISWGEMFLPMLSLGAQLLLFGFLALLLSLTLPSRRAAGMAAGLILMASFFVTSLARIDDGLETLAKLSPLNYYQSADAINGLNGGWLAGILIIALAFAMLSWWYFQRRDIRVSGEGGWKLPWTITLPWKKAVKQPS